MAEMKEANKPEGPLPNEVEIDSNSQIQSLVLLKDGILDIQIEGKSNLNDIKKDQLLYIL